MAAATDTEIREGLRANIAATYGDDAQVSAYRRKNPPPRAIHVVGTSSVDYDQTMRGGLSYVTYLILALAGTPVDEAAQTRLGEWKVGGGIKAAIESDRTLGGKVSDLTVQRATEDTEYEPGTSGKLLGCMFYVLVLNPGN